VIRGPVPEAHGDGSRVLLLRHDEQEDAMMPRHSTTAETLTTAAAATTDLAIRPADADSRVGVLRYELPALQQLVQDTFGDSSAPLDFDRIAMPTKGTVTFAILTPAGEQHPATMLGVVLAAQPKRAFWAEEYTGGGVPPDCTSRDGVLGVGTPGGICRECPFSQFDDDGTPPACTETMDLTFVGLDDELPTILTVHKMSVKAVQQYKRSLRKYRMDLCAVITELGLQEGRYRNGKAFTKLTLRAVGVLSPAEQGRMRAACTAFGVGSTGLADAGGTPALPSRGATSVTDRVPGEDDVVDIIPEHAIVDPAPDEDAPPFPVDEDR
jgi:hypothetical protein